MTAMHREPASANKTATALITVQTGNSTGVPGGQGYQQSTAVVARRQPPKVPKPTWHAPWEMLSVLSGHLGWVRSIAFDPSNEWFATGSADRTIKVSGYTSYERHYNLCSFRSGIWQNAVQELRGAFC
jgi:WD40 repeat protein